MRETQPLWIMRLSPRFFIALTLLFSLSSCSSDWWARGQTASPSQLFERASDQFVINHKQYAAQRPLLAIESNNLTSLLSNWITISSGHGEQSELSYLQTSETLRSRFISIEPLLSIGSRPAWAELAEQLRKLDSPGKSHQQTALFASRVLFLLSNELTVPAPART